MFAAPGLDAGLLIGGDHEFICFQRLAVPFASVQVEDAASLDCELRIAGKDPTAVIPGPNGILMKPAPDGAIGNRGDQTGLAHLSGDVRRIPAGKRKVVSGGQFAGQSLNLYDQFRGEKSGDDPDETAPRVPPNALQRTVCATC